MPEDQLSGVPVGAGGGLVEHDELLEIVKGATGWLATESWLVRCLYHSDRPSRTLLRALEPFLLIPEQAGGTDGGQE